MHIQAAVRRQVENGRAQDLTEGGDHDQIGRPGLKLRHGLRLAQALGLDDRQTGLESELFDGRRLRFTPAAGWAIGLGDDAGDGVRLRQGSQCSNGEIGRSHEHEAGHEGILTPTIGPFGQALASSAK
jgi:hypothetical protein